ncbi:hypothetical protein [Rhizobium sp. C4]|uniref:hypothetical protein n=1 Tax=Rhizobium sp. C4 TaxID=1349800 RepID=UPI001E59572D|nr:hypothetical protein [Rhizobium sp. C4]MCD2174033.1 hypothetical protein [Rhizobium sp. C4]
MAALIYELLFKMYKKMEVDRSNQWINLIPDESGIKREAFFHEFTSCWEWTSGALEGAGILKRLPHTAEALERLGDRSIKMSSPFFQPMMTLDEFQRMNFSAFETLNNYCNAMFTFNQFMIGDYTILKEWSPLFLEAVVNQDDIFLRSGEDRVEFNRERYREKVVSQWDNGVGYYFELNLN